MYGRLKVEPAAHCAAQPCPGYNGGQGDHDDGADGKHDGGPGQPERVIHKMFHQKFDPGAKNGDIGKKINADHQKGAGNLPDEEGGQQGGDGHKGGDGKRQRIKPVVRRGVKADQILV